MAEPIRRRRSSSSTTVWVPAGRRLPVHLCSWRPRPADTCGGNYHRHRRACTGCVGNTLGDFSVHLDAGNRTDHCRYLLLASGCSSASGSATVEVADRTASALYERMDTLNRLRAPRGAWAVPVVEERTGPGNICLYPGERPPSIETRQAAPFPGRSGLLKAAGSLPIPAGIVSAEEPARAEEVPYPEAPPAGPAILTVVEPGRGEEGRKTPEEAK